MKNWMVGVILAAGNGTRFGVDCCKALNRIKDTYLIEFALKNLIELNVEEAFIVVGSHSDLIIHTLGYMYKGIRIRYVYQPRQIGLINALVQAIKCIPEGEDVCLQLADEILIGFKTEYIKRTVAEKQADIYCGITEESEPEKIKRNYSVEIVDDDRIVKCTEKPTTVTNRIKGTGFCVLKYEVLQLLRMAYNEEDNRMSDLCDFMNYVISEGRIVISMNVAIREYNINSFADLHEAEDFV